VYFATHSLVAGDLEKFAKAKAEPALVLSIPEKPTSRTTASCAPATSHS
jgi:hypothetical protein